MSDLQNLHRRAVELIADRWPLIRGGLLNEQSSDAELLPLAAQVLGAYQTLRGEGDEALTKGLESFAHISFDFMRLQSRFMRKGVYRATEPGRINEDLYQSSEKMEGYYLDGLLLTYAFWPNHTRILKFFREQFVSDLPLDGHLLEVGTGHGLMAVEALSMRDGLRYVGVDISPSSLHTTALHFERAGVDPARTSLLAGDATDPGLDLNAPTGGFHAVMCCEVLEHVREPQRVLASLYDALRPSGRAFITTVANLEAEDHVYLYNNAEHIREHVRAAGFTIEQECCLGLPGYDHPTIEPLNYAAVLLRAT